MAEVATVTAQLDVSGGEPDTNGLENASCPFQAPLPEKTLILDHLRGAFLCFACNAMGPFLLQKVNGKRIAVCTLQRYREPTS